MRVCLMPSAFFPSRGGVEELTLKVALELQRRGHDVVVVANRWPGKPPAEDQIEGVPVRRLDFLAPSRRPRSVVAWLGARQRSIARLRELPRPDVLHVVCASTQLDAAIAFSQRDRIPLVLTTQGEVVMDAESRYQRSLYLRQLLRTASKRADALTACSSWTACASAGVAPRLANALVILNGVDAQDWDVGPPTQDPVICAWGRHVHQKGFDLLLAAFPHVRALLPSAQLLVGGSGQETASLQRLAGDGVTFLGSLDRAGVRRLLARSRVAVVPSRIEPFGIVALEALAAGRGLVYAQGTGLEEAAGGLGTAADVTNPNRLAEAIMAELRDPTSPNAGRSRARELAWSRQVDQYEQVYTEALESRLANRRVT